jgi:hypothetical protein
MNISLLIATCIIFSLFITGCANSLKVEPKIIEAPKSCLSTYQFYSSKNICDVYWDNKNRKCDQDLTTILNNRGHSTTPRSICGQPIIKSSSNICNITNISQLTPTNLCNSFNLTSNCTLEITSELRKRNLKVTPIDACGTSLDAIITFPKINLTSDNEQCQAYLSEVFRDNNPVKAACSERYKSIRDETILCRQELNTFIVANSIGIGRDFNSCGLPIPTTSLLVNEVKINSYRDIKSFTPLAISSYISQFNETKRSLCLRLAGNNDFDGSFCLYILDRAKKDFDSSYKNLYKAIDLGHPLALMRPYEIFKDLNNPKEKEEAFKNLIKAAQLGNISAAIDLGWIYLDKNPKNYKKALFWSEFSANAGHGEAASNLGLIYHKGLGVKVDYALAKYWYEKSLTMERYWSGQSQVGLGILYLNGTGIPKDTKEARRLFNFVVKEMPRASKDNINLALISLKKIDGNKK